MGYYRGDHYRRFAGDYYRGDPGFFSSIGKIIGAGAKVIGGAALGFLSGGGVKGAIAGAVGGATAATSEGITQETLGAGDDPAGDAARLAAIKAQHLKGPAGPGALPPGGKALAPLPGMALATIPGMRVRRVHPNKSTYVTRGGGTSRWPVGITVHPKGTEAVPVRRMNVANPHALRRALVRVAGFAHLSSRVRRAVARAAVAVGVHHRRAKAKK